MTRRKLSERMIDRLVAEGRLVAGGTYAIQRTYAGYWQRAEGAFSWYVVDETGRDQFIGSQWTVKEILAAPELVVGKYGGLYPGPVNDGLAVMTPHREPVDSEKGTP